MTRFASATRRRSTRRGALLCGCLAVAALVGCGQNAGGTQAPGAAATPPASAAPAGTPAGTAAPNATPGATMTPATTPAPVGPGYNY
ncbi:MAG: hypothetical protein QOH61_1535 [Chloroflexota bacterium]|jgi:hypothetical protein|nr:hypothetical protein [Chloroflexota bacterium]